MKRPRKIRWSTPSGVKQKNRLFFGTEGSFLGELSLFVLCTTLFFGAGCGMIQDVFEWEILTFGTMALVAVITVLVSVFIEVTKRFKPHLGSLLRIGTGVAGILFGIFFLLKSEHGKEILDGFCAVATGFLRLFNVYYGTAYFCAAGNSDEIVSALRFGIMVLCFLLVWWSRVRKRGYIPVLFPAIVVTAELLVGWAPEGLSLFAAALGLCLNSAAGFRAPAFCPAPEKQKGDETGWRKHFVWVPAGVVVLLLCIAVTLTGSAYAKEAVYDGKNRIRQKNKEIVQKLTDWTGWQEINVAKSVEKAVKKLLDKNEIEIKNRPESNSAHLDNSKPEYDEVAVLKVALDKKPSYGIYLLGFYADEYKDGMWTTDVDTFEEACKKAGYDPETVSAELVSLAAGRVAGHYGGKSLSEFNHWGIKGWIHYAKGNLIKTYFPYFSEVTAEGVSVEGDGRYLKETNITRLPFVLWNYDVDELMSVLFRGEGIQQSWEKKEWELWYEDYAEKAYLTVPNRMKQVKKVAEEIRTSGRDFFRIEGKKSVNFDRLNKAYQVADWMRQNTSYSLELPSLPNGSDPVEFFLGTSKQGYCMHYASASVMILRELGVPARYASGYVTGNFSKDLTTTKYEAVVLDSAAHAWVEIYMEGLGWIPVEVTTGYSVEPSGTDIYRQNEGGTYQRVHENWSQEEEEQNRWHRNPMIPFVTPKPTPTPPPAPTPSVTEGVSAPEKEESGISKTEGENTQEGAKPTQGLKPQDISKEDSSGRGEVNPAALLLYLLLGLTVLFFVLRPAYRVYRKMFCKAEERRVEKKRHIGNRQRIKLWNRLMYRKLRMRGKIRKRTVRDEDYETALQRYKEVLSPEDLVRYMCLVKAAAFSCNEFSEEEVEFCKTVYRKVVFEVRKTDTKEEVTQKDMR